MGRGEITEDHKRVSPPAAERGAVAAVRDGTLSVISSLFMSSCGEAFGGTWASVFVDADSPQTYGYSSPKTYLCDWLAPLVARYPRGARDLVPDL